MSPRPKGGVSPSSDPAVHPFVSLPLRYNSCEEFAADAQLVFNNCELFNEDTSEVGTAGHAMRRFFESRWAEFYSNKDK